MSGAAIAAPVFPDLGNVLVPRHGCLSVGNGRSPQPNWDAPYLALGPFLKDARKYPVSECCGHDPKTHSIFVMKLL
ncbi:hypothetical protein PDR5_27140 [Pseudomonas sp. DR 5-09]|nr:hypothetical protein PDR5_27140 [Pseudomonas sp. DR 5-09]